MYEVYKTSDVPIQTVNDNNIELSSVPLWFLGVYEFWPYLWVKYARHISPKTRHATQITSEHV